jgi:hypothetical protein
LGARTSNTKSDEKIRCHRKISQTDAKSQVTTVSYDLGRTTTWTSYIKPSSVDHQLCLLRRRASV